MQTKKDYDGAHEIFTKMVTICENAYGKDHSTTAVVYGDLCLLCYVKGDYDGAMEMHKRTLLIQESILGNHPDTSQIY